MEGGETKKADEPVDTIPVMVTQIRKCSKLYTAEYRVRKIVTHDDDVRLKGSMFNQKFDFSCLCRHGKSQSRWRRS